MLVKADEFLQDKSTSLDTLNFEELTKILGGSSKNNINLQNDNDTDDDQVITGLGSAGCICWC